MEYGYCRCSTNESRQDIDRQKRELRKLGIIEGNIYFEYESGSKVDRIQLNRLLDTVKKGDSIATTEVSRLTRSTKQLCEIIEIAKARNLKLIIGNFIVDCTKELDPMTQGMIMMWGVFSEMEKNIIRQRVISGMENAKAKGVHCGRKFITFEDLPANFLRHYPKYQSQEISLIEFSRLCAVSRQTIYKYLKIYKESYT